MSWYVGVFLPCLFLKGRQRLLKNLKKNPRPFLHPYPNQFPWPLIWFANFSSKAISPLFSRSIWSLARPPPSTAFLWIIWRIFATVRIQGFMGAIWWFDMKPIGKDMKNVEMKWTYYFAHEKIKIKHMKIWNGLKWQVNSYFSIPPHTNPNHLFIYNEAPPKSFQPAHLVRWQIKWSCSYRFSQQDGTHDQNTSCKMGVWKCCVPRKTQWFCWSLSLWKMAISLGYTLFSDIPKWNVSDRGKERVYF